MVLFETTLALTDQNGTHTLKMAINQASLAGSVGV